MKFIFLMDPLETVNPKKDTSYAIMQAAYKRGHDIYYLKNTGITYSDQLYFETIKVIPEVAETFPFKLQDPKLLSEAEADVLFIRTDPPFNDQYLTNTWLLDLATNIRIVNHPSGIRTVNEKIWCSRFKSITPKTIISSSINQLKSFLDVEKKIILKPVNLFGGQSIFILNKGDENTNVICETMTKGGTTHVIAQEYIEASKQGDKRILLLDGEILGAVLRVHSGEDYRNNIMAGGTTVKSEITARDREIVTALKPYLVELGLFFVGIDIIGDRLIEVNVTSPTCIIEMMDLDQVYLTERIIKALETNH